MIATFPREIDRAAAFQARLDAIDASLSRLTHGPRADQRARHLLFGILEELLVRFALAHAGDVYNTSLAHVSAILAEARAISERAGAFWPERLLEVRVRADALASRIFARVGPAGSWPLELQIPFDLATLLRRACEQRAEELLPLALLDVFRLLDATKMRRDPEPIEHLIAKANGGTWERPEEKRTDPIEQVPDNLQAKALRAGLKAGGKVFADAFRAGEEGPGVAERAQKARDAAVQAFVPEPPRALAPEVYEEEDTEPTHDEIMHAMLDAIPDEVEPC